MTTTTTSSRSTGGISLAGCFALLWLLCGLCTIFALIAAAADAFVDARHARWPTARATLLRSEVDTDRNAFRDNGPVNRVYMTVRFPVAQDEYVTAEIRSTPTS